MLFPGEQFELKQLADHNNFLFFLSCFFFGGGRGRVGEGHWQSSPGLYTSCAVLREVPLRKKELSLLGLHYR